MEENDELKKLREFKKYVHERLDKMGVPSDPEPEKNKEHGCRIEGRLNWIDGKLEKLDTMIQSAIETDLKTDPS
jgi:hypothetical protein